jgi:hypothetical protein
MNEFKGKIKVFCVGGGENAVQRWWNNVSLWKNWRLNVETVVKVEEGSFREVVGGFRRRFFMLNGIDGSFWSRNTLVR